MNYKSKQEKTNIRDNQFSAFHRRLNKDHYMQDVDHTLWTLSKTNYGDIEIVGFIEEKHFNIRELDLNAFQFRILSKIAGDVPAFCLIKHYPENQNITEENLYFTFYIIPVNTSAIDLFNNLNIKRMYLSEQDYYTFECFLRKEKPKSEVKKTLSNKKYKFKLPVFIGDKNE